jgi:hypothetical protein
MTKNRLKLFELKKTKTGFGLVLSILLMPLASVSAHMADPVVPMTEYTLFGQTGLKFKGTTTTAKGGVIGSNQNVTIPRNSRVEIHGELRAGGNLDAGVEPKFYKENVYVNGSINAGGLGGNVNFQKNVTYGGAFTKGNGVTVSGTTKKQASSVTAPKFPVFTKADITPGSWSKDYGWNIGPSGNRTLACGSYNNISFNNGTVLLEGNCDYQFNNLSIGGTLKINKTDGEVTRILIKNNLSFLNFGLPGRQIRTKNDKFGKVLVFVGGRTNIIQGSRIDATLLAPFDNIVFPTEVTVNGQILARNLDIDNNYNGSKGSFVPFEPAGLKLLNASSLAFYEETVDSDHKTRKDSLVTLSVSLSAPTTEDAHVLYTIKSAGSKYGSKESLVFGTSSSTADIVHTTSGASKLSDTLFFPKGTTTPSNPLKLLIVDDSLAELDSGDSSYFEIEFHTPFQLILENDPAAEAATASSLMYKIPLISDDALNKHPVKATDIPDQIINEDFLSYNITTRLDTIFTDPNNDVLTFQLVSSSKNWGNVTVNSATKTLNYATIADSNGMDTLIVSAADADTTIFDTLVVNVQSVNDAPSAVTSSSVLKVLEESSIDTLIIASTNVGPADEQGQKIIDYKVTSVQKSALFSSQPSLSTTGKLSFTLANDVVDSSWVYFRIQDDGGIARSGVDTSAIDRILVKIVNANDTPTVENPIGDIILLEDFADTLIVSDLNNVFGDIDGDDLSFSVTVTNRVTGKVSSLENDSLILQSIKDEFGIDGKVVVTATDGFFSVSDTFLVEVTPVNDAPLHTSGGNVSATEEEIYSNIWATAISGGPTNEIIQTLNFIITSISDSSLFSTLPAIDANGTLSFEGANNKTGSATVSYHLKDNGGTLNKGVDTSSSATFIISLGNLNDKPVLKDSISDLSVIEDWGLMSIQRFDDLFMDPDGDALVSTISLSNGNALDSSNLDSLRLFTSKDSNGLVGVTVTATDPSGLSVSTTLDINILPVNDAPLHNSGGNVSATEEDDYSKSWATAISVGPTNENTQTLSFIVNSISDSSLFSTFPAIDPNGVLSFVGAHNQTGSATVFYYLKDTGDTLNGGVNVSATNSFTISLANTNDKPVLKDSISNLIVVEDSGLVSIARFDSLFLDPDGDALVYTVTLSNEKALDSSSLDSIRLFTAKDSNGLVTVTLTATDPSNESISTQFDLNISPANDAPTGITLSSTSVNENSSAGTVIGDLGTVDIDFGDVFEYELIESSTYTANDFVQINGKQLEVRLTDSLDYETRKSFQIKLRSYDSDSAFVDSVFTINILNVNDNPETIGVPDIVLDEDFSDSLVVAHLDSFFTDPEGDDITYTLRLSDDKVNDSISFDSITFKSILNEFGIDTLFITAKDVVGNTVYDTVLVTVNAINDEVEVENTTGTIKENVNDSIIVAVVKAVDVDGDTLTYVIDLKDSNYVIDEKGNVRLKDGVTLDFENTPLDTILVTVSDGTTPKTISVIITIQNEVENSEVVVTKIDNGNKIWTSKVDTVWTNTDSVTITYREDGVLRDSLVHINSDLIANQSGTQQVVRVYYNETKDHADTVITTLVYSTKSPEITVDDSKTKVPTDKNGIFYMNDVDGTLDLVIGEYGKDPSNLLNSDSILDGKKSEGEAKEWIVTYTDIYGNTVTDTLFVILDTTPPLVEITRPSDDYLLTSLFALVDWQVEGEKMTIDTTETLTEGYNVIIRSATDLAGNVGSDSVRVRVILDGNKVTVTLENEVLILDKGNTESFEEKVVTYFSDRGRDREDVKKESWNLSFQLPDDQTDEFTSETGFHEAYYHDGSKKIERDLENPDVYYLQPENQIGVSLSVEMQFPVLSNEFDTEFGDRKGVCDDGDYMWDLFVDNIKIAIYDQLGQFVRSEILEGFPVGPRYQNKEGKVKARFDMPSLESDLRADDGRRWAAGVYLMHIQIQTRAMGINCNEGEKEISRVGTMKRQGYLRE